MYNEYELTEEAIKSIRKAGEIVKKVKKEIPGIVKKGMPLVEVAEKIESLIIESGGQPAFPVNLSINEIAAHYTPSFNDETLANGLLKIDFGVSIDGFVADNSITLDLEGLPENKSLIKCSEEALQAGIKAAQNNKNLGEIGKAIQEIAEKYEYSAIQNLSGHGIQQYQLHAAPTIPNYDNKNKNKLKEGIYAIEPFITTGIGIVFDGKPSGIYEIIKPGNVRDVNAREILNFIAETYGTLPFCSRWLVKKFGPRSLISLSHLESAGIIKQFTHLVEKSRAKVAQSEATILVLNGNVEVLTQ